MVTASITPTVSDVQAKARELGIDPSWLAKLLEQYGPQVIEIVAMALKQGLSQAVLVELFTLFGPALVQLLIALLQKKQKLAVAQLPGDTFLATLAETYLPGILHKALPNLSDAAVQEITQNVVKWLDAL